jgi:hypothetical protein
MRTFIVSDPSGELYVTYRNPSRTRKIPLNYVYFSDPLAANQSGQRANRFLVVCSKNVTVEEIIQDFRRHWYESVRDSDVLVPVFQITDRAEPLLKPSSPPTELTLFNLGPWIVMPPANNWFERGISNTGQMGDKTSSPQLRVGFVPQQININWVEETITGTTNLGATELLKDSINDLLTMMIDIDPALNQKLSMISDHNCYLVIPTTHRPVVRLAFGRREADWIKYDMFTLLFIPKDARRVR